MPKMLPLLALLIAVAPCSAIPPPDFGFPEAPNDTALAVTYQVNGAPLRVTEGELFGIDVPAQEPVVAVDTAGFDSIASYNGPYTLLMVDPDASYPQNPTSRFILHWLQTDMTTALQAADGTSQLVNTTAPRAPYRRPAPPTNSSAHRYILYAFFQPPNFVVPAAFEGYNATNRTKFDLPTFLDESNLGQSPAAAMYYYATNQSSVPQDFIAPAGATYPGGNGDMITAGPGPSMTASSPPTSATASATITSGQSSASVSAPTATFTGGSGRTITTFGCMFLTALMVLLMIA